MIFLNTLQGQRANRENLPHDWPISPKAPRPFIGCPRNTPSTRGSIKSLQILRERFLLKNERSNAGLRHKRQAVWLWRTSQYVVRSLINLSATVSKRAATYWSDLVEALQQFKSISRGRHCPRVRSALRDRVGCNSVKVALKHYILATDHDFNRAADQNSGAQIHAKDEIAMQRVVVDMNQGMTKTSKTTGATAKKKRVLLLRSRTLLIDPTGLEPATSTMSTWRSSQLSYGSEWQKTVFRGSTLCTVRLFYA